MVDDRSELVATVSGRVEPGFEAVRSAFERNFADHGEVGAAVCVYVDGRKVVDLWGGVADVATGRPYGEDTLQLVFSSTKGVTALCANLLAQRGELDVDAPVSAYWPEFARAGKADVPVRWLLCHKTGLPYIDANLTLAEALAWDPPVEALAAQEPVWQPGTAFGYHAVTYGWLVGEVIRRVTGRSVGAFFADEVARPLGLDFWIGLPDEHQARVAPLTNRGLPRPPAGPGGGAVGAGDAAAAASGAAGAAGGASGAAGVAGGASGAAGTASGASGAVSGATGMESEAGESLAELIEKFLGPDSLLARALGGVSGVFTGDGVFNRPDVRAAELPAANGVGDARSLAKLYAATVGPVDGADGPVGPLLTGDQLTAATTRQTKDDDRVLMMPMVFGLGYMLSSPFAPYGGARSFGHAGAGGSVGFADPESGIGFAYVMNRMLANLAGDPRSRGLIAATYEALGETPTHV